MYIYRILSILASPFIFLFMLYRVNKGKEDLTRLKERFGYATQKNDSIAPIIWLHCASVGETMIALNLVKNLSDLYPNYKFLLTTSTVTSANIVSKRQVPNLIHQYNPIDITWFINRFLNFWQPTVGIFIESEIWPNLIDLANKRFPLVLVNARISDNSNYKWTKCRPFIKNIFNKFNLILTQTQNDFIKFSKLGAINVKNLGNLKFSNFKPTFDQLLFNKLFLEINGRKVILASSTHEGDEEFIVAAYKALKKKYIDLLLIIAPRHPKRSQQIAKILTTHQLNFSIRTKGQSIGQETDVYLTDTIGELGLFYSVANISFIGGSLKHGGHNIIEASFFKTLIIFGSDMSNFLEIADEYLNKKAAISFDTLEQAINIIDNFLTNIDNIEQFHLSAQKILEVKKQILSNYLDHISKFIKNV